MAAVIASLYLQSEGTAPRLRIGVLLDSENLPKVFASILENILASNFADLSLLVFNREITESKIQSPKFLLSKAFKRLADPKIRRKLVYDLYLSIDEQFRPPADPLRVVDCSNLFRGIDRIDVIPIRKRFVHRFSAEAIDAIRRYDLDVLLRFGFNILKGDVLDCARYGIWSYHHGDNEYYRGGPSHFWELYERNPVSGVILQRLTEDLDGGSVLCKALFRTKESPLVSINRYSPYWDTSHFVIWKLNELHQHGWDYVQSRIVPDRPYKGKRKPYRTPTNWDMIKWLGPMMISKAASKPFERKMIRHWRIAVRAGGTPIYRPDIAWNMAGFRFLESPSGHFWADPFLFERAGKTYVFFEDYDYKQSRGVIGWAEVNADGSLRPAQVCLDTGSHLSYPMVFEHEGETYMIPESASSRNVVLYRATDFPYVWIPEKVLIDGIEALDTTAHHEDGVWWFFTTLSERGGEAKLMLFYADCLTGNWKHHPANPIASDIRKARSAGRLIRTESGLVRPSQNCAPAYGYSFAFNEVLRLTKTSYEERMYREVDPSWSKGLVGTHTYNSVAGFEVVDARAPRAEALV